MSPAPRDGARPPFPSLASLAAALARWPEVAAVEPVYVAQLDGAQATPPWGLDRVDQASLPLDGSYTYEGTGQNFTAYVFDTGVRTTHLEFEGRASAGWTVPDDRGPIDCTGHGTHV